MTCQQFNNVTTLRILKPTTSTTKQNIEPPESLEKNLIRRTNHEGDDMLEISEILQILAIIEILEISEIPEILEISEILEIPEIFEISVNLRYLR